MTPEQLVSIAVAFVAGQGFSKLIEMVAGWWSQSTSRKRSEVDRISQLLTEAQAQAKVSARRERIATEHAHEVRVLALQAGVPSSKMPVLDFRDDE